MSHRSRSVVARWLLRALLASLGPLAGCAPSFAQLVRDRHYREAGAALDAPGATRAQRAALGAAIEADLAPALHVHPVTDAELARLSPALPAALAGRALLVRLRVESTSAPIDRFTVDVALARGARRLRASSLFGRDEIAAVLGDALPQPATVEPSWLERGVHGAATAAATTAQIFSFVLLVWAPPLAAAAMDALRPPPPPQSRVVVPTDEDYARAAPSTEALYRATGSLHYSFTPGGRCDELLALPLAADDATAPRALVFVLEGEPGLARAVVVPLPPGGSLAERIRARFGEQMRTVRELEGSGGATR
jgi:hypothetical protein